MDFNIGELIMGAFVMQTFIHRKLSICEKNICQNQWEKFSSEKIEIKTIFPNP